MTDGADASEAEEAAAPDPELIIPLDPPINLNKGTYNEIRLREPKANEVRQAEMLLAKSVNVESMRRYGIALVARVSGVPESVISEMPISKLNRATDYLQSFIEAGRKTGGN